MTETIDNYVFQDLDSSQNPVGEEGGIEKMFPNWKNEEENVVFVVPHDDDFFLGGSLLAQAVKEYNGDVYVIIVTDGRMGYRILKNKVGLVKKRELETINAASALDIPEDNLHFMGYPDGDLGKFCYTTEDDNLVEKAYRLIKRALGKLAGKTWGLEPKHGLRMKLTKLFRGYNATRVVVPTELEPNKDHKDLYPVVETVARNDAICDIWAEGCGTAYPVRTFVHLSVYNPECYPGNIILTTPMEAFEKKKEALLAFGSQAHQSIPFRNQLEMKNKGVYTVQQNKLGSNN